MTNLSWLEVIGELEHGVLTRDQVRIITEHLQLGVSIKTNAVRIKCRGLTELLILGIYVPLLNFSRHERIIILSIGSLIACIQWQIYMLFNTRTKHVH